MKSRNIKTRLAAFGLALLIALVRLEIWRMSMRQKVKFHRML